MARILSFGKPAPEAPRNDLTYEEFYAEYYSYVIRYLIRHCSNAQDAEDLAAECFLYCYTSWDKYDPARSSLKSWLFMVVVSRLKNYYRQKKVSVNLDDLIEVLPDDDDLIGAAEELSTARETLAEALAQLPVNQRRAVIMYYFGNMNDEAMALRLNTSRGNARVLLSRGVAKLRVLMADIEWE